MSASPISRIDDRPIAVIGAGTLRRRVALMMSTQGGEVRLLDTSESARGQGLAYVREQLPILLAKKPNGRAAKIVGADDLNAVIEDA